MPASDYDEMRELPRMDLRTATDSELEYDHWLRRVRDPDDTWATEYQQVPYSRSLSPRHADNIYTLNRAADAQ